MIFLVADRREDKRLPARFGVRLGDWTLLGEYQAPGIRSLLLLIVYFSHSKKVLCVLGRTETTVRAF